jgi:hypothetical protein
MSPKARLPHLLRAEETLLEFAPLVAALRQDGLRAGWLEWSPQRAPAEAELFPGAGEKGLLRAVRVEAGRTVAEKRLWGAPVLADVLREHFRGCALVLVHQPRETPPIDAPLLQKKEEGWQIALADGALREMTTTALAAALRRPRPFA